jgi:hypothetical protein
MTNGHFYVQWMILVKNHPAGRGWPGFFSALDRGIQGGI